MDIREVRAMVIQLKKVDFSSCEEYLVDLIENYGYENQEIYQLNMELVQLYIGSRKYAKSFEMYKSILKEYSDSSFEPNVTNQIKIQVMRKMVHLAQISVQPTKDDILQELDDNLPFE